MKKIISDYKEAFLVTLAIVFIAWLFQPQISFIDDLYTDYRFNNQDRHPLDSTIVVLTFNEDDLQKIGGFANIQNHLPLLVHALNQFDAATIGCDIIFDELGTKNLQSTNGLVAALEKYKNVCIAVFNKQDRNVPLEIKSEKDSMLIATEDSIRDLNVASVQHLLPPYPKVLKAAGAIGHSNYPSETVIRRIPAAINTSAMGLIPAFSLQVIRLYRGLNMDSLQFRHNRVVLSDAGQDLVIPTHSNKIIINYNSGAENIKTISTVDYLKAFIDYNTGREPELDLGQVRDKIVLIGIDSPVKGQTLAIPLQEIVPSIFVEANILQMILKKQFIHKLSPPISYILLFIFILFITFLLFYHRLFISTLISMALVAGYAVLIYSSFSIHLILPTQIFIFGLPTIFFSLLYRVAKSESILAPVQTDITSDSIPGNDEQRNQNTQRESLPESINESEIHSRQEKINEEIVITHTSDRQFSDQMQQNTKSLKDFQIEKNSRQECGIYYHRDSHFRDTIDLINKVAPSAAPILVTGESGTGKELVARGIHDKSPRNEENFVALNCASIQETLLESELFGYEKGAFTSADNRKLGLFEIANNGTLFLDEIAEMNDTLQSKLLRVLQFNEFYRVGGVKPIKVDVRIVAATNKDPEIELASGQLRKDLFYRINTIRIHIPPLFERKVDIPVLIQHFLELENASDWNVTAKAMSCLLNYHWPGNVRQLASVIQRAVIFAKADGDNNIQVYHLPAEMTKSENGQEDLDRRILESLRAKRFSYRSIRETAKDLGDLNRSTVTGYLRGMCLQELVRNDYDINAASVNLAGSDDPIVLNRVIKKSQEYLSNLASLGKVSGGIDEYIQKKFKNVPKRYHSSILNALKHLQNDSK